MKYKDNSQKENYVYVALHDDEFVLLHAFYSMQLKFVIILSICRNKYKVYL